MKLGVLYICTGKYAIFWKEFYESCESKLLLEDEKYYFVFSDSKTLEYKDENPRIKIIYQENLGWPDNTLKRFHIFLNHEELYNEMDYLFFFNANLKVVKPVKREDFLPIGDNLMVTIHPGFYNKINSQFPYERNSISKAYIPEGEGDYYIAGGLNGGKREVFLNMAKRLRENIDEDENKEYIACWHDESHINNYIYKNNKFQTLTPAYLYPEGWELPYVPVILIRDKNKYGGHAALREGDLRAFCNQYREIYVYGAGIKGQRIMEKLNNMGIDAEYIISDGQEKNQNLNIKYISEIQSPNQSTGIVIAVKNGLVEIIKIECKKYGYKNIYIEY